MSLLSKFKKSHKGYNKLRQKLMQESMQQVNDYYQGEIDFYYKCIRENIKRGFVNFKFEWDVPDSEDTNVLKYFMDEFLKPYLAKQGFDMTWRFEYWESLKEYDVYLSVTPQEEIEIGDEFKDIVHMRYKDYADTPEYELG